MITAQPRQGRLSLPAFIAWLAIVGSLVFIVLFVGALPYISGPIARIAVQLLMAGAAAVTVVLVGLRRLDAGTPLAIPGAACVAVVAISAITSREPSVSREAFALLLLAATTYPLVRHLVWDSVLAPRVTSLIMFAGVAFVTAYLVQVIALWIQWESRAGLSLPPLRPADAALTTGTVNSIATYLELLVPTAIWALHVRFGVRASAALAVAAAFAVLVTGSRGAWAGVALAGVVVVLMNWPRIWATIRGRLAGSKGRIAALAVVAIASGVTAIVVLLPRIVAGDAGRIELWTAAVGLGLEQPLLGNGPGTWQDLRPSFPIGSPSTAALFTAHNGVLHVFAETGIAGLIAAALLVGTIAVLAVREVRTAPDRTQLGFAQAATASLVAVGVHALVDPLFGVPAVAVLTLFVVARLDRPRVITPRVTGPVPAIALGAAAIAAVALLVPTDVAMLRATNGNVALNRSDWRTAAADFDAAIVLDDRPIYRLGQALAAAGLGQTAEARAALTVAHATNPLTFYEAALARLAADANDDSEATRLARDVLAKGAYDPTATINAAAVLFDLGDRDGATAGVADAMRSVPSLIYSDRPGSLFDDDVWTAAQDRALTALAASDPAMAALATIRGGFEEDAVDSALERVPQGPSRRALELLAAADQSRRADLPALRDLVRVAPQNPTVLLVYEHLARREDSADDIVTARLLSIISAFNIPPLDQVLVPDGSPEAFYSHRLLGYPFAMGRQGPMRPYPTGMVTIEPVVTR